MDSVLWDEYPFLCSTVRYSMDVFLTHGSFVGLISSVIEGYDKEVIGVIFGDHQNHSRRRDKVLVSHVIPLQIADRKRGSVSNYDETMQRVLDFWDNITPYWPLGDFHSHPNGDTRLSGADKKYMKEGQISLVISIREASRNDRLGYVADGNKISGTLSEYFVKVAAWYFFEDKKAQLAELWCPFIDIVNDATMTGTSSVPGNLFDDRLEVSPSQARTLSKKIDRYEQYVFKHLSIKGSLSYRRKIIEILKKVKMQNESNDSE